MFIRRPLLLALLFYLFITVLFNYTLVCNALLSCNPSHPSDGIITEYITETSLRNIQHGQNPYGFNQKLFYPFYTSFALADPGSAHIPIYALLRTAFTSYQSLLITVLINLYLNYALMYLLLRKLKIDPWISLLGGLVFGAMPFISYRVINHYTYTPVFILPLIFLCIYSLLMSKSRLAKICYAFCIGIIGIYLLLANFYYFISCGIAIAALIFYSLMFHRQKVWHMVSGNILYFLISGFIFIFTLMPWIHAALRQSILYSNSKMQGFGGAWVLSSDLMNVFLPSEYNPVYHFFFAFISRFHGALQKLNTLYLSAYSRNAYAGLLLLCTPLVGIFFWKTIPSNVKKPVQFYGFGSLVFLLLSFGPFLQVFNRWFVAFEGVPVVVPLPFLLLHYIPGMQTLRAPGRFVPFYIFFFVLAAAYIWDFAFTRILSSRLKKQICIAAVVLVLFDQMYIIPKPVQEYTTQVPTKLYEIIAKDRHEGAVLEIPFTVRDGFDYRGNVKAVTTMKGSLAHNKPVIGGYIARVAPEIFSYYDRLPFISYVARIIDTGNADNGTSKINRITPFKGSKDEIRKEMDFLTIRYLLVKEDEVYSKQIETIIASVGFKKVSADQNYTLFERAPSKQEYIKIPLAKSSVASYFVASPDTNPLLKGWQFSKKTKFFVSTREKKTHLILTALSKQRTAIDVYINSDYIATVTPEKTQKTYTISMNLSGPGVQMIDFVVSAPQPDTEVTLSSVEVTK